MFSPNPHDLNSYLRLRGAAALSELATLDPDTLLTENAAVIIASLMQQHIPDEIVVDWARATSSPVTESTITAHDAFYSERSFQVPSSRLVVSYPLLGDPELLRLPASTYSLGQRRGEVQDRALKITIEARELTAEMITQELTALRVDVEQRVEWANRDVKQYRGQIDQELREAADLRKKRILNDRAVQKALGIPIQSTGSPRMPVPAQRRHVTLAARQKQAAFVPEPELDDATYRDILDQTRAWASSLERTPGTLARLSEEELRDLLLAHLNAYWQGAAGGELFNGAGKTDVLIRADNRNVFIGECKIWSGSKAAGDALDQLLSYLVWRDSKAALLMFIRTAKPKETIAKLHAAAEAHPRHVLTQPSGNPETHADYIFTADDEGRRVSLAVLPIVQKA